MTGKIRMTEEVKKSILEMHNDKSVVYTQREIAQKVGVSQAAVSKFLRMTTLKKMAPDSPKLSGGEGNLERVIDTKIQQINMLNLVITSQGDTIAAQKELIERLKSTQQEVVLQSQDQVIKSLAQEIESLRETIKQREATIKAQELTIGSLSATIASQEEMLAAIKKGKKPQK